MTLSQWKNTNELIKAQKTAVNWVRGEAKKWCITNGVDLKSEFRNAVDQGRWKFECLIIQCVGFDEKLFERLAGGNCSGTGLEEEEDDGE